VIDITPENSVAPIFLETLSAEYVDSLRKESEALTLFQKEQEIQKQLLIDSALAKLTKLGLTEEEAKAVIGL
jgi:hypothetical protein